MAKYSAKLPKLHEAQETVAKSEARWKILCAGRRFGKTRLGVQLCMQAALEGKRAWWVAPTFAIARVGWRAIEAAENGASCLRINPGNIGNKNKIKEVVKAALDNNCSIRVGVNSGSLEKDILEKFREPCPEALVESAIRNIKILEDENFSNLKVSVKSSDIFLSIEAYRQLSKITDYPLHLGITEAGGLITGSIKSNCLSKRRASFHPFEKIEKTLGQRVIWVENLITVTPDKISLPGG